MSTLAQTGRAPARGSRVGILVTALGTLVAIAVAVVLLTLPGSNGTTTATTSSAHRSSAAYAPLIQYRGTGAAPAHVGEQTAPVGHSGLLYLHHMRGPAPLQ